MIELDQAHETSPGALADVAAEAIRALNHATAPGVGRLVHASDAYEVIGSLERLVDGLPQALCALNAFLGRQLGEGRLYADDDDVHEAAGRVAFALGHAAGFAQNLADALGTAHNAAAALGTAS